LDRRCSAHNSRPATHRATVAGFWYPPAAMFTPRRSPMLLAALLLLAAALLPALHPLQHVDVAEATPAHCAHDHCGGSTAFEPAAAVDDDCGTCVLLRAGRDWHGTGLPATLRMTAPPVATAPVAVAVAPRPVAPASVRAR